MATSRPPRQRAARTFDAKTGQVLGKMGSSSDYIDYQLDPLSDPTIAFDTSANTNAGDLADPLPGPGTAVAVRTSPTPASALSKRLESVPWWVWALLGLGAGYFIARQYGHKIGRALAPAG